jgi:membrane protease YdiL (CAAX protease family)
MSTTAISSYSPRHIDLPETTNDFSFLIPTASTLALGIIYASNVPIGMAIGLGSFVKTVLIATAFQTLNLLQENTNRTFEQRLLNNPLNSTLVAPLVEEGLFRGFLQPLTARMITFIAPATACAFLGTSLSAATTIAIVATGALFGIAHLSNRRRNIHRQAFTATIGGIIYGVTTAQFGLTAAIAAHVVHNTLVKLANAFLTNRNQPRSEPAAVRV